MRYNGRMLTVVGIRFLGVHEKSGDSTAGSDPARDESVENPPSRKTSV